MKLLSLERFRLIGSLVVTLCTVALSMASTLLLKRVVDVALPQQNVELLSILCSIMLAAGVVSAIFTVLVARLNHTMSQNLVHRLRSDIFRSTQRMPLDYFTANSVSDVQTRISSDVNGVSYVLAFAVQGGIAASASLVTSVVIMLLMSWPIAILTLAVAVSLNMMNNRFAKKRRRLTHLQQDKIAGMTQFIGEHLTLSGVVLGRTMAREGWQRERFTVLSRESADCTIEERLAGRTAIAVISMTLAVLPVLAYWAAGTILDNVSLGAVIVITALQARISTPIQQLMQLSADVQSSRALFERIFLSIDKPNALPPSRQRTPSFTSKEVESVAEILVSDVDFSYGADTDKTLKSVNVSLPAGRRIFITGESGAGKSTLALVLTGLIAPQSGTVAVRLDSGKISEDMQAVATLVPQESLLFNASIRENLLFGDPECTPQRMMSVLRMVELDRMVARLPRGLETVVGEHGAQVSGGERQRLAAARSIIAGYPIMVFDEFTSGLDDETSEALYESLRRHVRDKTIVVVTHRLPSRHESDVVVTMRDGRIVDVDYQRENHPIHASETRSTVR
ncbi:ABC transporter ATP-binding protein [Streptomyces sp. NPDC057375]|uniref:ABC transporter ATP-binding protein n=1 Tax=Streptomyces sp. NPDC057375 TaxID=3346109 RepID=UPI00363E0FC2